jgi:hypothetical protein
MKSINAINHPSEKVKFSSLSIISFTVLIATWLLFAIDKETHQFSDLLSPVNLAALVVYFTPTFLVCLLLHHVLSMKMSSTKSMLLSLALGIPVSFAGIIYVLS